MNTTIIKNSRLILQPWSVDDASDYLQIYSNPSVIEQTCVKQLTNLSEAKEKIREVNQSLQTSWSIGWIENGEDIISGDISICATMSVKEYKKVHEITVSLAEEAWGKGITAQAVKLVEDFYFNIMGSEAIIIRIFEDNIRAIRVAEKCNYVYHSRKKYGDKIKITYIKIKSKRKLK